MLRASVVVLLIYGGLLYLTYYEFSSTPSGFIPSQDKGYLLVNVQMPDSTSVEKTQAVMKRVEAIALKSPGVKHTVAIAGQSILLNANAPNFGAMYVMLEEFHDRTRPSCTARRSRNAPGRAPARDHRGPGQRLRRPAGRRAGDGRRIQGRDRGPGRLGMDALQQNAERVVADGNSARALTGLFTSFRANTPWLFLNIDRDKVNAMGVSMDEVFNTLQVYLGSLYVNDFNRFGRTWQVNVQGDADFRQADRGPETAQGPQPTRRDGPLRRHGARRAPERPGHDLAVQHVPAAADQRPPAPGTSSGQALDLDRAGRPEGDPAVDADGVDRAGLAPAPDRQHGHDRLRLAVVLVFLVLAAQYESWSLPFSVILVVPMCLLCSVVGVQIAEMDINIFTQIGFIVLVGLACKNAILIVEFAKARREEGVPATRRPSTPASSGSGRS